jgi:hypothetical protein
VGFVVGRTVKALALNVFKVAAAAVTGIVVAVSVGWIGKDPSELAEEALRKTAMVQNKLTALADMNKDGFVDWADVKVWWARVEKVVMKGNLALSLGTVCGVSLAFLL